MLWYTRKPWLIQSYIRQLPLNILQAVGRGSRLFAIPDLVIQLRQDLTDANTSSRTNLNLVIDAVEDAFQ